MQYHIGCSGFYYKEWKGVFYPDGLRQKDWFRYYCEQFNTIEINSSFYRNPTVASLQKWFAESGDDFLFSVKAPRLITHYKKLVDCKELVSDFCTHIQQGLQHKLGCVLFQMPPSFIYTEERLSLITTSLLPGFKYVIEFRHKSWWQQQVYDALAAKNIIFCGQSYPGDIPDDVMNNADSLYYRFHGKPVLYKSLYSNEALQQKAMDILHADKPAFVYFNNTWGESALHNAKFMKELLKNK